MAPSRNGTIKRAARMALSVQKMQIFDKDFKELFQNSALSNELLYQSKIAPFAQRNISFDVLVFQTILH